MLEMSTMNTDNTYTKNDLLKARDILKYLETNTDLLWELSEDERIDLYRSAGKVS
jgi:hypothetical protein